MACRDPEIGRARAQTLPPTLRRAPRQGFVRALRQATAQARPYHARALRREAEPGEPRS